MTNTTKLLFPAPRITTVPTTGDDLFPVRRIFCIGKNYADHIKEMGGALGETQSVFFMKPTDSVICPTAKAPNVAYPPATTDLHYEAEIVLALGSGGRNISEADAMNHVYGVALGCDMTRRDLQFVARDSGAPWDLAKAFDESAVMGSIKPGNDLPADLSFALSVNVEQRQHTNVGKMMLSAPAIIAKLSQFFELKAGDLVYTGTPEGVGPLVRGDEVEITGDGLPSLAFTVA